jgi:hypothetical protein
MEISFVAAISDSSTDSNFNNHTGTAISDSSTAGNFNNHTGARIGDSSSDGTNGHTATGINNSSPDDHSRWDNNAAASDVSDSVDNSDHPSQPTAPGANCQIRGNSDSDCARREREAFLQTGECRTRVD